MEGEREGGREGAVLCVWVCVRVRALHLGGQVNSGAPLLCIP